MTTPDPFGARLRHAMDTRGPLCVGIDPHASLLTSWGLNDDVAGLERFTRTVVEALADRVAVLKPQSAFFERFGSRGIAVLEKAVAEARAAGALVLMDAKRGDIGSTMARLRGHLPDKDSPLFSDAVTVSPVPRLRLAAPGARRGRGLRRRASSCSRSPPTRRAPRCSARSRADGRTVAQADARPHRRRERGRDARSAPSARWSARRSATPACDLDDQRPAARPRHRRPGRDPGRPAGRLRRRGAQCGAERQPGRAAPRPGRGGAAGGRAARSRTRSGGRLGRPERSDGRRSKASQRPSGPDDESWLEIRVVLSEMSWSARG